MAHTPITLRLEAGDGSAVDEYRIRGEEIEVRRLQNSGETPRDNPWHRLTPGELSAHVHNKTAVAKWLEHRLGWRRLLRACTDPHTLQEFGIPENTSGRYAA